MSLPPRAAMLFFGGGVAALLVSAASPLGCLFPPYVADIVCGADTGTACVGPAPEGWSGPVELVSGDVIDGGCPSGLTPLGGVHYASPNDLAAICACDCDPIGIQCPATVAFFAEPTCSDAASSCGPAIQASTCQQAGFKSPANCNGIDAPAVYAYAAPPGPMGHCQASLSQQPVLPRPFDREAVLCSPIESAAGCAAGEQCVPWRASCFYRKGEHDCADPSLSEAHPDLVRTLLYAGWEEHRGCGDCQCEGLCAGEVNVYRPPPQGTQTKCDDASFAQALPLGQCTRVGPNGWPGERFFEYEGVGCTAAAPPTGTVTPQEPITVCCPP